MKAKFPEALPQAMFPEVPPAYLEVLPVDSQVEVSLRRGHQLRVELSRVLLQVPPVYPEV